MVDTIVGTVTKSELDPEMLNRKAPHKMFKDAHRAYFVQNGRIFNLAGFTVIGPDSSKKDVFLLQQEAVGKLAADAAGLTVTSLDAQDGPEVWECGRCKRGFKSSHGLNIHNLKAHGE